MAVVVVVMLCGAVLLLFVSAFLLCGEVRGVYWAVVCTVR